VTDPARPRTTPEGHTPEEPRPSELGKEGTPGAGMTEEVPHAADARAVEAGEKPAAGEPKGEAHASATTVEATSAEHAAGTHTDAHAAPGDEDHAHADDHAHAEPRLGPIDWPAWGYAVVGVILALLVIVTFFIAIS
jgi:hypothetical protein